jgi:1,4-dihydroxy-2-naphthoate octaprenyltransferase
MLYELLIVWKYSRQAPADRMASIRLVSLSFRLNWHFGALLVMGYLLAYHVFPGAI